MRAIQVDFDQAVRQPLLGWGILLLGAACAGMVATQFVHVRHQQAQEVAMRMRLTEEQEAQKRQAMQLIAQANSPRYVDDKRWQRAAVELSFPWAATLQGLDRVTKPPVFLTSVKSEPSHGRLQLEAEAPNFDAILEYVAALQGEPALAGGAQLMSHEEQVDQLGHGSLHFVVQAQWAQKR